MIRYSVYNARAEEDNSLTEYFHRPKADDDTEGSEIEQERILFAQYHIVLHKLNRSCRGITR